MFNFSATPPLSLYIHIPWCVRKCPYCDFNSHAVKDSIPEQAYVDALLADLEHDLPSVWGRVVETIFIGGGTPSLFSPDAVDRLLCGIRARITLDPQAEITLEANPGTVDREYFYGFREAGVNRLSIGVQSFDQEALRALGRVHDPDQALAAIEIAATVYDTYNLDLMFGLPGQDMGALQRDLDQVRAIAPPHWSCYHLTIEPNTYFASFTPADLPDDDLAADMLDAVSDTAKSIGLTH